MPAAAANLYYVQPLLHTLAGAFGVSNGVAGLLVTASQIGYVLGLALLVPLGDLLERRRLITTMLLIAAAAQVLAAARDGRMGWRLGARRGCVGRRPVRLWATAELTATTTRAAANTTNPGAWLVTERSGQLALAHARSH